MSGPKYYNFPMSSPSEAAAIYAQLSAFQPGVRIRVVNNELQFTVSNSAWYAGVNEYELQSRINKAKARYAENEKMKRILNEKKREEKGNISQKKKALESAYQKEKKKLTDALNKCQAKVKDSQTSVPTPFGNYSLSEESKDVTKIIKKITNRLSSLDNEYKNVLKSCDEYSSSIDHCASLTEVDKIRRKYNALDIEKSTFDEDADKALETIQNDLKTLKNYIGFLHQLYCSMQDKNLSGYFDRIKSEVSKIDIFDTNASSKMNAILVQIEKEIEELDKRRQAHLEDDEISHSVASQINTLNALKSSLKPMVESVDIKANIRVDYTNEAQKRLTECDNIVSTIENLEFVDGINRGTLDRIKHNVNAYRSSRMSENTVRALDNVLKELHEMEKNCLDDNDVYVRFKKEQDKYYELYIKLQGTLSVEGAIIDNDASYILVDPMENMLINGDKEKQISDLHKKNELLEAKLKECFQSGAYAAIAASVEKNPSTKKFKPEKDKDGSMHMIYTHKENKGAIFDASINKEGRIGIYPRGVMLCNGKAAITKSELKKVHSSCDWAKEIEGSFHKFGVDGASYEEMPEEELNALYDEKNYYQIKTLEESIAYLRFFNLSDDEILEFLSDVDREKVLDILDPYRIIEPIYNPTEKEKDDTRERTLDRK